MFSLNEYKYVIGNNAKNKNSFQRPTIDLHKSKERNEGHA